MRAGQRSWHRTCLRNRLTRWGHKLSFAIGVESPRFRIMPRSNLISLFDGFLKLGDDAAVVQTHGYRRQSRTYAELSASAFFWSRALGGHGIEPGDRVLLWGANSTEWIACFWAILLRGAIAVPMDYAASPDFVQRTIQQSGAKLILRDRSRPELNVGIPSRILND